MITQRQRPEDDQIAGETSVEVEVERGQSVVGSYMTRSTKAIVLFDGVCNMCNGFVNFVIDRDSKELVRFASQQSPVGRKILTDIGFSPTSSFEAPSLEPEENQDEQQGDEEDQEEVWKSLETMVLIEEPHRISTHSTAIIRTLALLGGLWKLMLVFLIIPSFLRDPFYNFVGSRRYKWFGRQKTEPSCRRLNAATKWRFLSLSSD